MGVDECALKVGDANGSCDLHATKRDKDAQATQVAGRGVEILLYEYGEWDLYDVICAGV